MEAARVQWLAMSSDTLQAALIQAVKDSGSPGAVACIGNRSGILFLEPCGMRAVSPHALPAEKSTPYDLASLTKVVATTTSLMLLHGEGAVDLDEPVGSLLAIPDFRFTVRHCLTHSAGLVAGYPYYKDASSLLEMLQRYSGVTPSWPAGSRRRYSDVSFMILAKIVELAGRDSLDRISARRIFEPLGMNDTAFNPPAALAKRCAATEVCLWGSEMTPGRVHDENACSVGGVSGHAGLFSSAPDLALFCQAMLNGKVLPESTLAEMMRPGQVPHYPWQGLGWKVNPWACGSEGYLGSRRAIGHTGWTGTSIWMDFDSGLFCILLGNTCHPTSATRDNPTLRRTFHAAVAAQFYPQSTNVHTGLDRVVWDGYEAVKAKRLALLTHRAAVDEVGRGILDVLALEPEMNVRAVYTPEHGFSGEVEAGKSVSGEQAGVKARVISLYGAQKAPTAAELAGVDLFVVDLQDVGARWYTYMATMLACMRACAQAGKPVLVLDRPNPVGGVILEGPVASVCESLVCCAPIPARHGMTLGELALFFNKRLLGGKLNLTVSQLDGWRRRQMFGDCQLPWVAPSPNIPTPETALLYTGMCLFEAANINEGRGTETPFRVMGAPWMDPDAVLARVDGALREGLTLRAVEYTPRSIPGKAAEPRYRDTRCRGIEVGIEDAQAARPFALALALLAALRDVHGDAFRFEPKGFDILAGGPAVRTALEAGQSARAIVAGYAAELRQFDATRPKLYA